MAATTTQLVALANDSTFRQRVRNLVLTIAAQVYAEPADATHNARVALAVKVFAQPSYADQLAEVLVSRTNLSSSTVSYDFDKRAVVTDASDAAILSQIYSDWNMFAGV